MGYFKRAGVYDGKPYFQQIDSQNEGSYLYYTKEDRQYQVGATLGGAVVLLCTDKSGHIVPHHWQCLDWPQYRNDPDMRLVAVTNVTPCCRKVTIELSGDVAKCQSDVAGDYVPMDKFSMGRHIYKHKYRDLFLHIPPGLYTYWSVRNEVEEGGSWYIASSASGSLCPADQRNNYNHRRGWESWRYQG